MTYDADQEWRRIRELSDRQIEQIPFGDVIVRSTSWELPEKWSRVVRVRNVNSGMITERCFKTEGRASNFILKQCEDGHEIMTYDNSKLETYCREEV